MKKALHSKLLSSKKIIGTVLRKSRSQKLLQMSEEKSLLTKEVEALKDQVENLKAAINTLQADADKKDIALDKLVKEKEKVTCELLKHRRANRHLTKQLDDERRFYYKEKENYCHEMNEYKKLKESISASNVATDKKSVNDYMTEVANLKRTLSQTLTSNYNLSIKFLRMRNTKSFLKHELNKMKVEHEKIVNDLKGRLETITFETRDALELKIEACVSPSSKKYLQVIKQNSSLMYENLYLQLEVDRLNLKVDKLKLYKTKSETNSRLRYLRNEYCPKKVDKHSSTHRKHEKGKCDKPEKNTKEQAKLAKQEEKVIKIFERLETPAVPIINDLSGKKTEQRVKIRKEHRKSHKKRVKQVVSEDSNKVAQDKSERVKTEVVENNVDGMKVSFSQTSSELKTCASVVSTNVVETQSAPDIVQSAPLVKQTECKEVVIENKI